MKDIQKSIKLVESFDAVGKKSKLQELAQKQIASVAGLQEDANLVGSIASALVKYCKHAETTPMDMSPADQLRCLPASLNQKLTAMDKNQRSDLLKQAEKQAYTQMLGDDGEYDTDRLDELSNTTLNSYASKARGEANWAGGKAKSLDTWATDKEKDQFRNSNTIDPSVKYNKEADPLAKHSQKRFAGAAAADKKAGMNSSSQPTPYDWDKKGDSAVAGKPGATRSIREQALQHSGQRTAGSAGEADSYYGRARKPNKSENGVKIYDLTPEEITAYNTAYDANEESQDFKDWGRGNLEEVSLGNYTAKAAKSKALAQMDKAFGYGGDGNSNADSTIKKRTAGLERAQERISKSKDAASAKAKEDNRASDIANKEKYEKELAELKGQFDSNYDRSDDHSYWTKHKEMAAKIKDLEKRLGGSSEASGGAIEAYGVRGMNSKQWRKTFKNQAAFDAWLKLNDGDVEVHGTRNPNALDEEASGSNPSASLEKIVKRLKKIEGFESMHPDADEQMQIAKAVAKRMGQFSFDRAVQFGVMDFNKGMLSEAAADTKYVITKTNASGKTYKSSPGNLATLISDYAYTLETGKSYEGEKGNKKINLSPKTINDLVKNLNNAASNAAKDGNGASYTSAVEKQDAKELSESVDVASAITLSPDALISILKLAGMQPYTPAAQSAAPQTGMLSSIPTIAVGPAPQPSLAALSAMIPDDLCIDSDTDETHDMDVSDKMDEDDSLDYANSPDEEYCDTDSILRSGNDMHRSKRTFPKVAGGDNPMQQVDIAESELMKQFKSLAK